MKRLSLFLLLLLPVTGHAQLSGIISAARAYINANIVTNGTRAITGAQVNTALNDLANGLQYIDTARRFDSTRALATNSRLRDTANALRTALTYTQGFGIRITSNVITADTGSGKLPTQDWVTKALAAYVPMPLWTNVQGKPSSFAPSAHTHVLADLLQSGATSGQVPQWNGSAWVPATLSGGGGITVETDPVWTAASSSYYTKTQSDGRFLQSYTETDPVWTAASSSYRTKLQNDALYAAASHTHTQSEVVGLVSALAAKEASITAGTSAQYWRGDKTWQTLDKTAVGLSNVLNVDATNATNLSSGTVSAARMPSFSGDITTSAGSTVTTLATSGVSAGSYTSANITVDNKGRVTAAANGTGGGGGGPAIGGAITGATSGSVLFAGASGKLSQDNSNLFWDSTNLRLGLGVASPIAALDINGSIHFPTAGGGSIYGGPSNAESISFTPYNEMDIDALYVGLSSPGHRVAITGELKVRGAYPWEPGTVLGTTAALADASAVVEMQSSYKGFLPPRMTTTERNAISSPAEALTIYNTTVHKMQVWDGSSWQDCW